MSDLILKEVEKNRLNKLLPIYEEVLNDLESKPKTSYITLIFRSISFFLIFISIIFSCYAVYYAVNSSKKFGDQNVFVDIDFPYSNENCQPVIVPPTLSEYSIDPNISFQNFIFRAGPGAQYYNIGGNPTPNTNTSPPCGGPYTPQYFYLNFPFLSKQDQIIKVTNASMRESLRDNTTFLPSQYLSEPAPVILKVQDENFTRLYSVESNKTVTLIYRNGWYLVGTVDSFSL